MTDRNVKVTLNANVSPYVAGMRQAADATGKVDKAGQSMAVGMTKMAAAAGVAAIGLSTFTKLAKDSIAAATQLQDSTAKMQVVFGSASGAITKFANDSTQSFGLSKRAAYDATSTFAIFGKAAGLTGNELTKFSTDLTKRSVDLSSFFGGSVEQAITAVGAALRGESEPIRAYGVLLDDATLRAKALEMGLISSVKEGLTPQARALAAQAEVLRQSSDAAGDYERTLGGMANSQKEAAKAWEDAKATFGEAALPAATAGTKAGASGVTWISRWFSDMTAGMAANVALITGNSEAYDNAMARMMGGSDDAAASAGALGSAAAGAAGGVDALAGSAAGAAGAVGTMDDQMKAAIGGLFGFIDAQQAVASSNRDMLGMESELRDSARQTGTARTGSAAKSTKASEAERKAAQKVTDAIREKDRAEMDAEIKSARRKAERRAESRADAGARADVQAGVKRAIDTDKAARAGQDIDGFNQGGSVGEATGSLTKGEQAALDKKIDAIRARHKKALDAQLKGLKEATTTARATAGAVDSYSFSLDANTEAGRRNLDTISGQVDKVQANAQAVYDAAILDGKGAEEAGRMARDALIAGYDAITRSATNVGFARGEVEKYLKSLGLIPSEIETAFKVDTSAADAAMKKLMNKWKKEYDWTSTGKGPTAPTPKVSTPAKRPSTAESRRPRWDPKSGGYTMFAAGGEIGGPGSATSDSVPIWASRGEYMVNAQQYAANRDLVRAINNATGPVAAGGFSIGAVNVTESSASNVRANVIDALAEAAYRGGGVR
jgi:hypothetical protein